MMKRAEASSVDSYVLKLNSSGGCVKYQNSDTLIDNDPSPLAPMIYIVIPELQACIQKHKEMPWAAEYERRR